MVAVTGATGHLGTVLVRQLLDRGEDVSYVTRSGPAPGLVGTQAKPVNGELGDEASLEAAFRGATIVYHAAARISIMPGDWDELYRVNVEGTRSALRAARAAGAKRFVYIGTVESFPLENRTRPVRESLGIDPEHTAIEYGRSKAIAVQEVLAESNDEIEVVVCAPTAFIGPPDYRRSPIGEVIHDFVGGKLPAYVTGGFDFVDVRDVADGVVRAGERGKPGRIYLLGGEYTTIFEIMQILEEVSGVRRPRLCLPHWILLAFMPAIELYYRTTGRPPQFTRSSLRLLRLNVTVDSARARSELGYTTRPIRETLRDTVEWLRQQQVR